MLKFIRYEFDIINLESKIRIYLYIQNIHFIIFVLLLAIRGRLIRNSVAQYIITGLLLHHHNITIILITASTYYLCLFGYFVIVDSYFCFTTLVSLFF